MSNFVFSKSIEISVIEHRLLHLFEMLEKAEINYYFPSILFNETFWQLPFESRVNILRQNQSDWVGEGPASRLYLIKDPYVINIIKSLKITYFSYTKLDFLALAEILEGTSKFALMPFASFGGEENNPITTLNSLIQQFLPLEQRNEDDYSSETLAKVSALDFYTRFSAVPKINTAFFSPRSILPYLEKFFISVKTIDEAKKTKILKHTSINLYEYQDTVSRLQDELQQYDLLKELFEKEQIHIEPFDITTHLQESQFDYVLLNKTLSVFPTEILTKYNNTIYHAHGRLTYTDSSEEGLKKTEILKSGKEISGITKEDLKNLDFEISFKEYSNKNVIKLLEEHSSFKERIILRFSISVFKILIELVKSLKKQGVVYIWDYDESNINLNSMGLMSYDNGEVYTFLNFDTYTKILHTLNDLSFTHSVFSSHEYIALELGQSALSIASLKKIHEYMLQEPYFWRRFFDIENITFKSELEKVEKKFNKFQHLKKKKIYLLGIPTLLYNLGFTYFKKEILAHPVLKEKIKAEDLVNNHIKSYANEYMIALVPSLTQKIQDHYEIMVSQEQESEQNHNFYQLLDELHMDKVKVMAILNEYWIMIINHATTSTLKLLRIEQK